MNSDIRELTSKTRDLVIQMKKVKADVTIVKNEDQKLVNQQIKTERQSWANVQYSKRECLEVVGIPIYWKLMFPGFLVNLEYMMREKIFRHVIV